MDAIFTKDHIQTIIAVLVTVIITIIIENILRSLIKIPKKVDNRRVRTYVTLTRNLISIAVYIVSFYIILVLLGINILPLIASVSIIGVFLAYGAGSFFKDFVTGFFLISQETVVVGDYIKVDNAEGHVESIKFRNITLRSLNGAIYIIPNGQVGTIINYSTRKSSQFVEFTVKTDQNIDNVLSCMNNAITALSKDKKYVDKILPGSVVNGIDEFKPLGPMMVSATIVTSPTIRIAAAREYRYLVKKEFEKNKILFG